MVCGVPRSRILTFGVTTDGDLVGARPQALAVHLEVPLQMAPAFGELAERDPAYQFQCGDPVSKQLMVADNSLHEDSDPDALARLKLIVPVPEILVLRAFHDLRGSA
jgi:hypothetical protein